MRVKPNWDSSDNVIIEFTHYESIIISETIEKLVIEEMNDGPIGRKVKDNNVRQEILRVFSDLYIFLTSTSDTYLGGDDGG